MTMSQPEIERRVRSLDNDVGDIYGMLTAVQETLGRHTRRLGDIGALVEMVDAKVDALDGRVGAVEVRLDSMDGRLDSILEILRRPDR